MFVDTFIRRPILATVCSLVIILAGVLAIPAMPIAQYPQIAPPTVNVLAIYTGANAETISDSGATIFRARPACVQLVFIDSESLPTGIVMPRAGQNSSPTACTVA